MTQLLATPASYWRSSRSHRYSLLFALPLLLTYEALVVLLSHGPNAGIRNGADVILQDFFYTIAGPYGPILFGICLMGGGAWLVVRDLRAHGMRLRWSVFPWMLLESLALAIVFGVVVAAITARVVAPLSHLMGSSSAVSTTASTAASALALAPVDRLGWWTRLMVSVGAGLYEELLFRVILVSGLMFVGERVFRWRPVTAGICAAVVSALVFSAFHYVGRYGDVLQLRSFIFRAIAGLAFSALYLLRGFGITAWTHALYDVLLLV
ncbi:MAG TPA: CPBP family intramembrane glutamic endopeptidase [Gemmatimonadaceae bacterium]